MPRLNDDKAKEARELLDEIMGGLGWDAKALGVRCRIRGMIKAKKYYIRVARRRRIPCTTIGNLLGLHHSTVLYHADPMVQERKRRTRTRGQG